MAVKVVPLDDRRGRIRGQAAVVHIWGAEDVTRFERHPGGKSLDALLERPHSCGHPPPRSAPGGCIPSCSQGVEIGSVINDRVSQAAPRALPTAEAQGGNQEEAGSGGEGL